MEKRDSIDLSAIDLRWDRCIVAHGWNEHCLPNDGMNLKRCQVVRGHRGGGWQDKEGRQGWGKGKKYQIEKESVDESVWISLDEVRYRWLVSCKDWKQFLETVMFLGFQTMPVWHC